MKERFFEFTMKQIEGQSFRGSFLNFIDKYGDSFNEAHITMEFILKYKEYIDERINSPNSRITYFAFLKALLNKAILHGYDIRVNMQTVVKALETKREASEGVYITKDEMRMLENYEPVKWHEKFARNTFLLCAYTGCRLYDYLLLSESNISEGTLSYTSNKTKVTARVPLHPVVPQLITDLKRFNYSYGVIKSTTDREIKNIFKKLGVNKNVSLYRHGKWVTCEKSKLVSAHTARISFATNLYLDGYSPEQIKGMMGHTSTEMTSRYIKVTMNDFVTGDKNYLFPQKKNAYETKVNELVNSGYSIEQAKEVLTIIGMGAPVQQKEYKWT